MRTVFLDQASLHRDDLDFSSLDEIVPGWQAFARTSPEDVPGRIKDAGIVITNKVVLDHACLSAAPALKLICVAATGTNNIDMQAAAEHKIAVCNVAGYATASVTEHVFGLMIHLLRNLGDYQAAVFDGRWVQSEHFCYHGKKISELAGKTLGIIGYGELGKAVAAVARAFSMNVLIGQRPGTTGIQPGRVSLEQLLEKSDIVSLHCPLAENTRHLIDKSAFERMPAHSILINTARGGLVNEADLIEALDTGQIAAAAMDVIEQEPPTANYPLLQQPRENLLITPHIAWASQQARQRMVDQLAGNIRSFLSGGSRNRLL